MADSPGKPSIPVRTANVQLTIRGRRLALKFSVPDRSLGPNELLPFYRAMSEGLMSLAVHEAKARGHQVSCKAGCGACCRQLVPISPIEARHLARLVESMPEPRRSEIAARFAQAREQLEAAGLMPRLSNPQDAPPEQMRELNLEYWALRIPCPFLENESCSIYHDRPIACREYLVVTDPKHCAEARPENVRALEPPGGPITHRLPRTDRSPGGKPVDWVPLILSPDYAREHPDEAMPRPSTDWVGEFFEGLPKE